MNASTRTPTPATSITTTTVLRRASAGWLFTTNHKDIGTMYLVFSLIMFLVGGSMALVVRAELFMPGLQLVDPGFFNTMTTVHALIMVFGAVMPATVGLANWMIPIQIGARDMAFPTLNMLSFWTAVPAAVLIIWSFFVTGGAAQSGWTSYVPLAIVQTRGQTRWALSLLILGLSSLLTSVNFITTIINMRAPGMTFFRLPLTVWALFITAILLLLALPVLSGALIMMIFDRVLGTTFFLPAGLVVSGQPWKNAGGGQALLWQHLFWFFGHPEVYIMILPAMGIISEVLPVVLPQAGVRIQGDGVLVVGIAGSGSSCGVTTCSGAA